MRRPVLVVSSLLTAAVLSGCSGGSPTGGTAVASGAAAPSVEPQTASAVSDSSATTAGSSATAEPATGLVGADCAGYADGPSVADEPVLDVMARDERLSGFTAALTGGLSPEVDLTGELGPGRFTVFAPVDGNSFTDPGPAQELAADPPALRFLLDYHLVPGQQLAPEEVVSDGLSTLQGWELPVFGPPQQLAVSEDRAGVVCGGIVTANAVLYLIDASVHPAGDYEIPRD